ncbi:MAG: 3-hydroxyacyl-CoA dehydrogenase [Syntrophomonadaceae bacterium]|nr:3-hydroxyacyl-CoA dehydrogenase [Syntrophomonadaceae bacterium]
MKRRIRKVAILGSGTMGSGIAAQCAASGISSYLLDIVPGNLSDAEKANPVARTQIAQRNRDGLLKTRPAQLYTKEDVDYITAGNMEDNLGWLKECDWIVEAVPENLAIKKDVLKKIAPHIKPGAIVSSNTSTISITTMAEDMPIEFRKNWLGTHFFNPVRYMKLLEIIPGADTDPEILQFMADFGERVLGKSIVWCKDNPGFIANRFGNQGGPTIARLMTELDLTFSEIDAICGPAIGRPKTGSFGLMDLVGLDIAVNGTQSIHGVLSDPAEKFLYEVPELFLKMMEKRVLGNKTKGGFYKRVGKEKLMLNPDTFEYGPQKPAEFPSLDAAKAAKTLPQKLEAFYEGSDKAAQLVWKMNSSTLQYATAKIPEISDDIVNIDNAMEWGYNHKAGPLKMWNGLDLPKYVARIEKEGGAVAPWVKEMFAAGITSFYKEENGVEYYYSIPDKAYKPVPANEKVVNFVKLKQDNKVVFSEPAGTLYDIGDGVVCLQLHSKNNAISPELVAAMEMAKAEMDKNWEGMVITGGGRNFCVGADLTGVVGAIQSNAWDDLAVALKRNQDMNMALKYSLKPVVVAPYGQTLGGGCEIVMHGSAAQAAAETYIGLVEVGVGLLPAAGGCKEATLKAIERTKGVQGPFIVDFLIPYFQNMATAAVATSAKEGVRLAYLKATDGISLNSDFLVSDAKKRVLRMVEDEYNPPVSRSVPAPGKNDTALLKLAVKQMVLSGVASEYDWFIACKIADVLAGGEAIKGTMITEQYLLDLEVEAFLSLCGQKKTQDRIMSLLKTGKPLRN